MNCTNCGQPLDGAAAFCGVCGTRVQAVHAAPVVAQQPVQQPAVTYQPVQNQPPVYPAGQSTPPIYPGVLPQYQAMRAAKPQKLTGFAKAWCWLGIVANLGSMALSVVALTALGSSAQAAATLSIVATVLAASGYVVLLCGKKPGFFMVCGASAISMVGNIVFHDYMQVLLVLAGPIITWLLIRENWESWGAIGEAGKADSFQRWQQAQGMAPPPPQQSAAVYQQPQQAAPAWQQNPQYPQYPQAAPPNPRAEYFYRHGRKFKTWSIVNTCMFFMFVLPIIGIITSNRAQKAQTPEEHEKYIRWALVCNLGTYALIVVISIINGLIRTFG